MENTKRRLLALALAICLSACLVQLASSMTDDVRPDEGEDMGSCSSRDVKKCCSAKRAHLQRNIIVDLIGCLNDLWNNLMQGNFSFPKGSCCKLPIFNWICNPGKRGPRTTRTPEFGPF